MSTLQVDSFAPRLGGTSFGHVGIAKLGVSYGQAGPTVNNSWNVSSVTDTSTGIHAVNHTNNAALTNSPFASISALAHVKLITTSASAPVFHTLNDATTLTDGLSNHQRFGDLA